MDIAHYIISMCQRLRTNYAYFAFFFHNYAVMTSIFALVIAGVNPFIYAVSIAGILIPPYSAFQEQKITDCRAMKETNLAMDREMENLKFNNERLQEENASIEGSVGR
jgi:uncharacterized membrane protein (DUF106 family)